MQQIESTIIIKAPIDRVFGYVSEPASLAKRWPDMMAIEEVQRLPNGGKRFRWVAKIVGVRCEGTSEDIEFMVHRRIVRQIGGGFKGTVMWGFGPEGDGTQVTLKVQYTIPHALLSRHTLGSIIKQNGRDITALLANLKTRVESQIVVQGD